MIAPKHQTFLSLQRKEYLGTLDGFCEKQRFEQRNQVAVGIDTIKLAGSISEYRLVPALAPLIKLHHLKSLRVFADRPETAFDAAQTGSRTAAIRASDSGQAASAAIRSLSTHE